MLNKELLRFQFRNGAWHLRFVRSVSSAAPELAASLLQLYQGNAGTLMRRGELEMLSSCLINGACDVKLARGLDKLILDNCDFSSPGEFDYPAERRKLFSGEGADPEFTAGDIYGDLADNDVLQKVPSWSPDDLLLRYDLALVQGMILNSNEIVFVFDDPPAAELRKLMKYLKFFRLLAEFTRHGKSFTLNVSGPCSLFANPRKYALALAAFFPAVVNLPRWKMTAVIELDGRKGKLLLDESSKLVSYYRNFSACVPEEVQMFHRLFRQQVKDWEIVGECGFLNGGRQKLIFPDLSFRRVSGKKKETFYLELFHRWHKSQLRDRLALLREKPQMPLLLGIDRSIADEESFSAWCAESENLKDHLFRFRDFPGVERVAKMLDHLEEVLKSPPEKRAKTFFD